jgi:gamma-polyglutamate biosynthesis protein CapC
VLGEVSVEPGFTFPIFPAGSLAGSVTTTVWVGVLVSCFFNLRFGWVLSGLVVPGYIVPLLLLKPWAAAVIVLEAIITYLVVWAYSEHFSQYGLWNGLFGRDRFFAIFLVSVMVRVLCETFLFPSVGEYVNERYGINFDYRNNLHSFGLIIVALLANQFWKPGLRKGWLPAFTSIFVTFLLVRYVLMEFTNFNIGNLDYLYEDVARSMLASPKTYIILLTTAFFASRMNLEYGWEFSGILIPSLLALQWYQPYKLLFTFVETFIILILGSLLLRLNMFRNSNIQGARKIMFFFNVGFLYHMVLGHLVLAWFPEQKVTDLYGFGYLLTTLLAIRMHDKDITARVSRATLQTSLAAVVLASLIGFGLTYVPNLFAIRATDLAIPPPGTDLSKSTIVEETRKQKIALYRNRLPQRVLTPLPEELDIFGTALQALDAYARGGDPSELEETRKLLWMVNYEVTRLEGHYLYLHEREPSRGWGTYVVNLKPANDLLVEVPAPLDEWGAMDAGTSIYTSLNVRALALSGSTRRSGGRDAPDVLENASTMFRLFQRSFGLRGILQVRGHTTETVRELTGKRPDTHEVLPPEADSVLWVKSTVPEGLNLAQLKEFIGPFHVEWGHPPWRNLLRNAAGSDFAELVLNRKDARSLMFKPLLAVGAERSYERDQSISGYLQDWLLAVKDKLPDRGSNLYVPAQLPELLYMDQEVLTPLVKTAQRQYSGQDWTKEGLEELRALSATASAVGYEVIRYRHVSTGHDYLILTEREDATTKRFWGTYVFRLGPARNYVVQIPRPVSEVNVFEYGVMLFERLGAKAILIGASHPLANIDGSADIIRIENKENLFNLVNQVVLRESQSAPMAVVQCRAFGFRPDAPAPMADAILSLRSGVTQRESADRLTKDLIALLDHDLLAPTFADGSISVAGYEVGGIPQSMYVDFSRNKEFVVVWISPVSRAHYRQETENIIQEQQFRALAIETVQTELYRFLAEKQLSGAATEDLQDLRQAIREYMETQNVVILSMILKRWPEYSYRRIMDISSKQSFFVVMKGTDEIVTVANLFPLDSQTAVKVPPDRLSRTLVGQYVDSRSAWLEFERQP